MTNKYTAHALNISVFICGAVVMIYELVGSRMLAPYVGTSIYVWTSIIGVILGSLSLGYWLGGKLADKNANLILYSLVIFLSGVFILLAFLIKETTPDLLRINLSIQIQSLFLSILLFAPSSILLGIISPYAVKLKMIDIANSASTVGNLYAISTLGSILGTFFAGYYLIPHIGTAKIILTLALILIITSIVLSFNKLIIKIVFIILIIFLLIGNNLFNDIALKKFGYADLDTQYNRVLIYKSVDKNNKEILNLKTDPFGTQSLMYLNDDSLVSEYTKYYRLAEYFKPNAKKSLMLGGCAYSYPKEYLKKYPNSTLDVVEIDKGMTEIAKRFFKLKEDPRLTIYHEDARIFLNRATNNQYDVIFGDAFNSFSSIPFQLTTKEAVQKHYNILNSDGIVILNLISSIDGKSGKFLRAEYATYKSIFPQVYIFPVNHPDDGNRVQNIMLVALKTTPEPKFETTDPELAKYLSHKWNKEINTDISILTDDFAPVDYYKYEST